MQHLLAVFVLALVPAIAPAQVDDLRFRSFDRFALDPVSVDGLWGEIGTRFSRFEERGLDRDQILTFARLAAGPEWGEMGLIVPWVGLSQELPGREENDNGIGDVRLYGKLIPLRTDLFDVAVGLDASFPSADENEGLGSGSVEFLPFGSAAVHHGRFELRGHLGYRTVVDEGQGALGSYKAWVYGGGPAVDLWSWGDRQRRCDPCDFRVDGALVAFRAEFLGDSVDTPGSQTNRLTFQPGLDVFLSWAGLVSVVRPMFAYGLTHDTEDWAAGGSLALLLQP